MLLFIPVQVILFEVYVELCLFGMHLIYQLNNKGHNIRLKQQTYTFNFTQIINLFVYNKCQYWKQLLFTNDYVT